MDVLRLWQQALSDSRMKYGKKEREKERMKRRR
jgi:hypothetical protein